ncbi:CaiB/BaiF CoA transferase family protein [Nocardioides pacificus]
MPHAAVETSGGPLAGLVVIDLSSTLPGAQATQFLADAGADVILVEPPGGSPLRQQAGWPALLRGKRSVTLDLYDEGGLESLRRLLAGADVLVTTLRPSTAERIGLTAEALAERFPRLVAAMITGWGSDSPYRHYKGWEGLVAAKMGLMHAKRQLTVRPGPAFVSVPWASWGASQAAVHGILAALVERESSGLGQVVESDLVRGVGSMDTYNWFYEMVIRRYPGAYSPMDTAYDDDGKPQAYLIYALLIAATKDGTWLQFAQTAPRLMQAWLVELDLVKELGDPKWAGFPMLPTAELRTEWWQMMLDKVAERTTEEWQQTFLANTDVSAETFLTPDQAFEHPQIVHEGRVITLEDPEVGPVTMPSTMVQSQGQALTELRPAPRVGEHDGLLDDLLAAGASCSADPSSGPTSDLPLDGVTIVEFGTMFAGPYGATLLTDLGARVIKIETLGGDNIRNLVAFPEAGGARVLQGKESVAVDLTTPEGLEVVHEIVKHCDVVLQCFRAGAAERAKVDEATLKTVNPGLIYLSAPGYGVEGPHAARPAYAPTVGAASGLSSIDAGIAAEEPSTPEEVRRGARALHAAGACPAVQADGVAALGVASSLLLGIYAKRRGIEIPGMVATMLGTAHQALIGYNSQYAGRADIPRCDDEFLGFDALYRLYPAADGWVFLAAPTEGEWAPLVAALAPYVDLSGDGRFIDPASRRQHDAALAEVLGGVFAKRDKQEWEEELVGQDVGLVAVAEENLEVVLQGDESFAAGYSVEAVSPIFDEHRRLAPLQRFSRSRTKADAGCTLGQHTDAVLAEVGLDAARIAELREREIIG